MAFGDEDELVKAVHPGKAELQRQVVALTDEGLNDLIDIVTKEKTVRIKADELALRERAKALRMPKRGRPPR